MLPHSNNLSSIYLDGNSLILSSIVILIIGYYLLFMTFKNVKIALSISLLKTVIFYAYFYHFYSESNFNFIDQKTYFDHTNDIYLNYTSSLAEFLFSNIYSVKSGGHTFYLRYSVVSFFLFGVSITSPITLNIITSYLAVFVLNKILIAGELDIKFRKFYLLIYLLN